MVKKNSRMTFRLSAEDYERFQKLVDEPLIGSWGALIRRALEAFYESQTTEAPSFDQPKKTAAPKKPKGEKS